MVVAVVGLRVTAHAVPDDLCAVFGYGLAVAVVGQKGVGGDEKSQGGAEGAGGVRNIATLLTGTRLVVLYKN